MYREETIYAKEKEDSEILGKKKETYNDRERIKEQSMLFSELKCKDVINLKDCKCLGKVADLEFDERNGCIHKIIVPKGNKLCNIFKMESDYVIPYRDIKQIGPDIILVDICF